MDHNVHIGGYNDHIKVQEAVDHIWDKSTATIQVIISSHIQVHYHKYNHPHCDDGC